MKSFTHAIGSLFQPIFHLFGWLIAFFYGIVPSYALAIVLLTIVIMGALTPLTIKSTKSMIAMQKLQPEIKKLQQKYKGVENRQTLNEELMKLYKEEGANPVGGCLPVLLQAPFLFILYSVIKGLANKVLVNGQIVAQPRYIPTSSKMYHNLVSTGGQIKAFGMDLNLKLFSPHSSFAAQIPFILFVGAAVGLQYFQMAQMNNRNKKSGQEVNKQAQTMQRFMPIIFAYFYMIIPAAVVLYMIISTIIRIITQDLMFRSGVSNPSKGGERVIPAIEKSEKTETKKPSSSKDAKPSSLKSQSQPRSNAKRKRKAR